MAVLKNDTQNGYVRLDRKILENRELKLIDRGMIATLMSLPNNWNFSIRGLEAILPDKKSAIGESLKRIEAMGYLTRTQRRATNGYFSEEVLEIHQIPITLPRPDLPHPENRDTENSTQYNNNKYILNKECNSKTQKLSQEEYQNLLKEFGQENVEYQLNKIKIKHYKNCENYKTLREWCLDYQKKVRAPQKNSFNNFNQRVYDNEELEKFLLMNSLTNCGDGEVG